MLKFSKKRPEIPKSARNPDFSEITIFGKSHGNGPGQATVAQNSNQVIFSSVSKIASVS